MESSKRFSSAAISDRTIASMPIKPRYVKSILDGTKRYEFRRTRINPELTHFVVYSCSPAKRIVAIAEVEKVVHMDNPENLWKHTRQGAGILKKDFMDYFAGARSAFAIAIKDVITLDNEVRPTQILRGFSIPQCYRYVDGKFLEKIADLGLQGNAHTN